MSNIVAIVGRPNVGKSTLFNRFTENRDAIVDAVSGVTRDRHYGHCTWNGRDFSVIDTGGYVTGSDDVFESQINLQVQIALEEADQIIWVLDVATGITDLDEGMAKILRKSKKPVFLAINKVDNNSRQSDAAEFYSLGFENLYNISAISGSGTGDLLDTIVKSFVKPDQEPESEIPKFAVVGKPNAGKSSFINVLLGNERNIVTEIAGTTRDSLHTRYNAFGFDFDVVDTAGIRKKASVHEDIEFYSVMRAIKAIEYSDVCLLMVDATEGFQKQDLSIYYLIKKNQKGIVVLINKWDLIEKDTNTMNQWKEDITKKLAPFTDVPIVFTSVTEKQRIHQALELAVKVFENRKKRIPTSKLNDVMLPIIEHQPPPASKGKYVKIKFVTQLPTHAPAFAFFCNLPQYVKEPYKRFLENKLRANFDLTGVPIRIFLRKK